MDYNYIAQNLENMGNNHFKKNNEMISINSEKQNLISFFDNVTINGKLITKNEKIESYLLKDKNLIYILLEITTPEKDVAGRWSPISFCTKIEKKDEINNNIDEILKGINSFIIDINRTFPIELEKMVKTELEILNGLSNKKLNWNKEIIILTTTIIVTSLVIWRLL